MGNFRGILPILIQGVKNKIEILLAWKYVLVFNDQHNNICGRYSHEKNLEKSWYE